MIEYCDGYKELGGWDITGRRVRVPRGYRELVAAIERAPFVFAVDAEAFVWPTAAERACEVVRIAVEQRERVSELTGERDHFRRLSEMYAVDYQAQLRRANALERQLARVQEELSGLADRLARHVGAKEADPCDND